jgi:16S rRNA (adenine1518-N6/adenine1519-N6)-dimethyltransferase
LTARLAAQVGRVIAVERDRELARALPGELAPLPGNVHVIEGDALTLDWSTVLESGSREPKVVGNIPYAITTPLIDKALAPPMPGVVVFLVQREVADRLAADPGSKVYGALSVGVQAVAAVERLFDVPAGAFRPRPKVDSAVVRMVPLAEPLVAGADQPAFRRFVTALFGRRRKQLVGALRGVTGRDRSEIEAGLEAVGVDPTARSETLPPSTFIRLFHEVGR